MFINSIATAVPPDCYTQAECFAAFEQAPEFARLKPRSRELVRKVLLADNGIDQRHVAVAELAEAFQLNPDALHRRFEKAAPTLATEAARKAVHEAGLDPAEIDAVIVSTCTGYLCPGLTSYVTERVGLRPDVHAMDLVGQGCGASAPNLRTAHGLLKSGSVKRVLCICVEVCSAAFYLDDDPGVLVSACLFGDGAAAVVVSNEPGGGRRVEWKDGATHLSPADRDFLRFEQRGGMLRNLLDRQVPAIAARHVENLLNEMLVKNGLKRDDISGWILHSGGRDVLKALGGQLGLSAKELHHSAETLRLFGNVSSPSVLFTLERALREQQPGGWWWLTTFGAGFSCHGTLLRVE